MEGECPKDLTGGIEEVMEGKDGHNWEGRLGSRKGTEDPGKTEGRSLAWWKFEGKAGTSVSQDVTQERAVMTPKYCWRRKRKRK